LSYKGAKPALQAVLATNGVVIERQISFGNHGRWWPAGHVRELAKSEIFDIKTSSAGTQDASLMK
jgi:hypothetical protein